MSDRNLPTKKRTRGASSTGSFTRSKSHIHFHLTRSGQTRPDSYIVKKKLKSHSNPIDSSFTTAKDLRAHRVFPHSLKTDDDCQFINNDDAVTITFNVKGLDHLLEEECGFDVANNGFDKADGDSTMPPDGPAVEINSNAKAIDRSDSKVLNQSFALLEEEKVQKEQDCELVEADDGIVKGCLTDVHSTPPEIETFGPTVELKSNGAAMGFVSEPQIYNKTQTMDAKTIDQSRSKVLNQRIRSKLYKTPTSFSYRRLLPYLEEMERDYPCRPKNQNTVDPGFSERERHDQSDNVLSNIYDQNGDSNQIGDSIDSCVQMTPPDAVIYNKPGDGTTNLKVEPSFQKLEHSIVKSFTKSNNDKFDCSADEKQSDSIPKSNMVLRRCSRVKLFKTPGSFSYRRMLPFLKDIAKQDDCASGNKFDPKLNSMEEKPDLSLMVSDCQEKAAQNSNGSNLQAENLSHESSALPSVPVKSACDNTKENFAEAVAPFDPQQQHDLQAEQKDIDTGLNCEIPPVLNVKDAGAICEIAKYSEAICEMAVDSGKNSEVEKDSRGNYEIVKDAGSKCEITKDVETVCEIGTDVAESAPENSQPSATSLSFLVRAETLSKENGSLILHQSPMNSTGHTKSITKFTDDDSPLEGSSKVETAIQLAVSTPRCKRGILKTTPRGCRGVCACLNCSSFHLHAERAFEFSRIQMQDAEEVALDLIKTISSLRYLLEKPTLDRDDSALICMNEVKDACKRASEAEELAKSRLDRMNYDLDVHCRIPSEQRPTVRFANYVQEKVIPRID
ncbi:hypothetical protein ACFE04_010307 [Oxalis oulophora]